MGTSSWLKATLGAVALGPAIVGAYIDRNCPDRCVDAGPTPGNWTVYPDFKQVGRCQQTLFYDFNLFDPVDEAGPHRIHACSSYGYDFKKLPSEPVVASLMASPEPVDVQFELGWFRETAGGLSKGNIKSLLKQTRAYIDNGHGSSPDRPFILYGQSGQATLCIYIDQGLLKPRPGRVGAQDVPRQL